MRMTPEACAIRTYHMHSTYVCGLGMQTLLVVSHHRRPGGDFLSLSTLTKILTDVPLSSGAERGGLKKDRASVLDGP